MPRPPKRTRRELEPVRFVSFPPFPSLEHYLITDWPYPFVNLTEFKLGSARMETPTKSGRFDSRVELSLVL